MPTDIDFSKHNVERRLAQTNYPGAVVVFAARATLRVAPRLVGALGPHGGGAARVGEDLVLPVFRALAAAWVAGQHPTHSAEAAPAAAAARAAVAARTADAATAIAAAAARAADAAAAIATAAAGAADAVAARAADAYALAGTAARAAAAAWADIQMIDHHEDASVFAARPLWLTAIPAWARDACPRFEQALLRKNQDWRVWTDWYRARLEGRPANEALEVARVLIADKIWKEGPRAVNAEIARLIAQHEKSEPAAAKTSQDWDFFLSYSNEDEAFARWMVKLLTATGLSVFVQFSDIPVGSNFVREMQRGLAQSSRFIALLSPGYARSDHCQAEWAAAYNTDPRGTERKLVQFLVRVAELPPLARQIVYKPLVGLSPADAAAAILQAIGYSGTVSIIPSGWPGGVAFEEMQAAAGSIYEVAPGAELLLERQQPKVYETAEAAFTPEQLFADFAREVEELAAHVGKGEGNVHCSNRLRERVSRLHQSTGMIFAHCDVLAVNKRLVWVLRAFAEDQADGVIPPRDLLEHYAADLYGYYQRLELIFPQLKPFRDMDARHRFTLPTEEEDRAIREVYRIFGDPAFAKSALSRDLSDEMKQAGESIKEAKEDAARKKPDGPSEITIESHVDAATRSLAVWGWLSNAREKFVNSGKDVKEFEKVIEGYEELYDRTSPQMIKYIGYLLKWFF